MSESSPRRWCRVVMRVLVMRILGQLHVGSAQLLKSLSSFLTDVLLPVLVFSAQKMYVPVIGTRARQESGGMQAETVATGR